MITAFVNLLDLHRHLRIDAEFYKPEYAKGIRWDDKFFEINWPLIPTIISEKDQKFEITNNKNC